MMATTTSTPTAAKISPHLGRFLPVGGREFRVVIWLSIAETGTAKPRAEICIGMERNGLSRFRSACRFADRSDLGSTGRAPD